MFETEKVMVAGKIYSGCLSSCLIPRDRIKKVYNLLCNAYYNGQEIRPLDNHIRNLMLDKQLRIGVTAPFLTSVEIRYISDSTIKNDNQIVTETQEFCTLLRQSLSTLRTKKAKKNYLEKYKHYLNFN